VFVAHLRIGGPLRADASGGDSALFVNDRELTRQEVDYLARYVAVPVGRYWLDDDGNVGLEGSAEALLNLYAIIRSSAGDQDGDNFWSRDLIGAAGNSSGGCVYVSVDGAYATSGC
jgi:hypothetical protein